MGSSSNVNTNYPTGVLSGLWGQANQQFATNPSGVSSALTSGLSGINALPNSNFNIGATGQNTANSLLPYVSTALTQGFDPQKALYDKTFQQQQGQNLASQAMQGVAMTPYGAGLTEQGNQNFDIAWQQAQLANQAQGASTASQLAGAGMGALGTGVGLTQQGNQNQISDYLNYAQTGNNAATQLMNAILGAYSAGTGQFNAANQASLGQQGINNQQLGGLGSLIGSGLNYAATSTPLGGVL